MQLCQASDLIDVTLKWHLSHYTPVALTLSLCPFSAFSAHIPGERDYGAKRGGEERSRGCRNGEMERGEGDEVIDSRWAGSAGVPGVREGLSHQHLIVECICLIRSLFLYLFQIVTVCTLSFDTALCSVLLSFSSLFWFKQLKLPCFSFSFIKIVEHLSAKDFSLIVDRNQINIKLFKIYNTLH